MNETNNIINEENKTQKRVRGRPKKEKVESEPKKKGRPFTKN